MVAGALARATFATTTLFLTIAPALAGVVPALAGNKTGAAVCPCVDPWEGSAQQPTLPGYGANYCSDHDASGQNGGDTLACISASPPAWCSAHWCYVSAANCARPHHKTHEYANVTVDGAPLHYSYETCGVINPYDIPPHEQTLRALKKLRISYPGDSGSGYTILTTPDGKKAGSVVEFARRKVCRTRRAPCKKLCAATQQLSL